jgi:hypothetical protein
VELARKEKKGSGMGLHLNAAIKSPREAVQIAPVVLVEKEKK